MIHRQLNQLLVAWSPLMMMSDDANDDGFYDVTKYDVIDDDVVNVSSLHLSNWLKAVIVSAVVAILVILLLSTHHSMLLV